MKVTLTKNIYTNTTTALQTVEFDELNDFFVEKYQYDGPKENYLMFIMGELKGEIPEGQKINRCDVNVLCMSALVFDIDNGAEKHIVIDPFTFAKELDCKCLLASSASSTKDHPRGRIIVPCTRDITSDEYRRIQRVVYRHYYLKFWSRGMTEENFVLDRKMMTTSQAYYLPQQPTDKVNGFGFVEAFNGPLFDPDAYLMQLPPAESPSGRKPPARKPSKRGHEPSKTASALSLEQAIEGLNFFDAGDPKDRFMTCLVFAKNWPYGRSAWESWHRAGSTKWEDRKDFGSLRLMKADFVVQIIRQSISAGLSRKPNIVDGKSIIRSETTPMKLKAQIDPQFDRIFDPSKYENEISMDNSWFEKIEQENNTPPEVTDKWISELELKSQQDFLRRLDASKGRRRIIRSTFKC